MKSPVKISVLIVVFGLGGLALFITLIVRHGAADVAYAVAQAGWGVAAVVAFHFVTLFFDSLSWRALIVHKNRPGIKTLLLIHSIGDSVSTILPVAQVGGEMVRVRMLVKTFAQGQEPVPLPEATSSVLVGMTLAVATQIVFTLTGLGLLILLTGHHSLIGPVLVASVIGILCGAGFYAVQRVGIFRIITGLIARIAKSGAWDGLVEHGEKLDQDVRELYSRRSAIVESTLWTFCTWAAASVEVWIGLWALGFHTSYFAACIIESMGQGIRSAMFLVPGALGVQEGGYLIVGRLLGITSEGALALSLLRRVRDLAYGVPGVLVWQWLEGGHLWRSAAVAGAEPAKAP